MTLRTPLLFAVLAACTLPALASPPSYRYLDVRAAQILLDEVDAQGLSLSGSFDLGPRFFVTAGYSIAETDTFTVGGVRGASQSSSLGVNGGARQTLAPNLDLVGSVGVVNVRAKGSGGFKGNKASDTGFTANVAIRRSELWIPALEVAGGVGYLQVFDEGDTTVSGELLYHFMPRFAATLGASLSDEATSFSAGLRFDLGASP